MTKLYIIPALLIMNLANAQFGSPQFIDTSGSNGSIRQYIKTADINNDGKKEIIVGSDINSAIRIYGNNGNLSFAPKVTVPGTWQGLKGMDVGDLNNDGLIDIISLDGQGGKLYWHPNVNGAFPIQIVIATGLTYTMGRVICADVTGDGKKDLMVLNHTNVLLYTNTGNGTFSTGQETIAQADSTEFYDNILGDFNNDGYLDFAIATDGFLIFTNNGTGQFTMTQGINSSITMLLEAADYNNDGYDDMVIKSPTLKAYKNTATGTYNTLPAFTPNNHNYKSVSSADVDGDGDIDLIAEDDQTASVFWYKNDGTGIFSAKQLIYTHPTLAAGVWGVHADDLDNDGDNDLIWTGGFGQVVVHENQSVLSSDSYNTTRLSLYPNPAENIVFIRNSGKPVIALDIYNSLGQLIHKAENNNGLESFDISHLSDGSYFVKLSSNEEIVVKQIVKGK